MQTHPCKLFAGALAALMAAGTGAQAATLTYDSFFPAIGGQQWDGSSVFSQFNPTLGTLDGVTYEVAGVITFSVSQSAPFAIWPDYSFSKGLTLNGTGLSPKSPDSDSSIDVFLNGGLEQYLQPGTTISQTIPVDFLRAPDLGLTAFVGSGAVTTDLQVSEDSDICDSEDLFPYGNTYRMSCTQTGGLTVSVTYDYTPVPEPRSVALLGLGLLGLGAAGYGGVRRRARPL